MADYRGKIELLDNKIIDACDDYEKLSLLTEAIELNKAYIRALRRPIPAKIIFGILILPLGLIALFPQAIVRSTKANIAKNRVQKYEKMRRELRKKNSINE